MITEQIPKSRQTLMFSATYTPVVEKLAKASMKDPVQVTIAKTEATAPKIDQRLFWVPEEKKINELMRILKHEDGTFFVFVKAKEKAYQVWRLLHSKGFEDVTYIHSDLPQDARELAVAEFKSGKYRVIIATDVMGRGIDVDDVAHVVNYDVPREPADYIHRIGRTGRRGQMGNASTFAIPGKDDKAVDAISKLRGVQTPPKVQERAVQKDHPRNKNPRTRDARPAHKVPRQHSPKTATAPAQTEKKVAQVGWFKKIFGFLFNRS
jgi:ATP-dependent RNA helicase RhlE